MVAIIGACTIPVSAIISYPAMILSRPPIWFREWFLFGATFQNTVALPLVLIQTICAQIVVPKRDAGGAIITNGNGTAIMMTQYECQERGELYIFMYIFLHSLFFWVVAYDVMPNQNKKQPEEDDPATTNRLSDNEEADVLAIRDRDPEAGTENIKPTPIISQSVSTDAQSLSVRTLTTTTPGTQTAVSDVAPHSESADPVAVYMTGSFAAALHSQSPAPRRSRLEFSEAYAAGSFYGGTAQMEIKRAPAEPEQASKGESCLRKFRRRIIWLFFHILSLCARPPIIAQLLGMFVGLIQPLQEALFSDSSVLRPVTLSINIFAVASTAVTNLSMSGGLGLKIRESKLKHLFGGDEGGLTRRANLGFVITRMFLIPGVLFALTYLLQVTKLVPSDRLLFLVLYMQALTPSANMCVVVPQILGNHQASGALSLLVLSQYIIALPSMLLWLSLAFYLTSGLQ